MTANRIMLAMIPPLIMIVTALVLPGIEQWLAAFGKTEQAKLTLARIGLALPYVSGAAIGLMSLFATNGSANIKTAGWSVFAGCAAIIGIAVIREGYRLWALSDAVAAGRSVLSYADPATMTGGAVAMFAGLFAIRVAMLGNAAFARSDPKRIRGRRALHGEAEWMKLQDAEKLFSEAGGIVIGEKYRVDRDSTAALAFRADRPRPGAPAARRRCFVSTARSVLRMVSSLPVRADSKRLR